MVMQAEHIPVHLGAMPSAVAAVLGEEQRPGESWILNDPYRGGTHLPDITVITPLFHDGELAGFAASRAHHADVGAEEPGSMPAVLAHARRRGRGDPADPADRRACSASSPAGCATRASARPTCAPSSPPAARAASAWPR